jgi:starch synthase
VDGSGAPRVCSARVRNDAGEGPAGSAVVHGATMEILLVATELSPWISSTDTADEIFALARTLRQLGHDVTVMAPFDNAFERGGLLVARRLTPLSLPDGVEVTLFDAQMSSGSKIVLLGMPAGPDARLVSTDALDPNSLRTAAVFARAVAAFVDQRAEQSQPFDVVHLFDWTASLAGVGLRKYVRSPAPAIVLSVHDARQTGSIDRRVCEAIGDDLLSHETLVLGDRICLLRGGILAADTVVVPSEGHLVEWTAAGNVDEVSSVFSGLTAAVASVPGGVDYSRVNPATNPRLVARYDAEDASAKRATKAAVQRELGFGVDERPLVLFPGPLNLDAGADLVLEAIDSASELPLSLCIWSMPDDPPSLVAELERRLAGHSSNVAHRVLKTEDDLHRGFAAADFVVYPNRHTEGQVRFLAAQRYGAIVIAMNTPGLRDAIVDCDAALETGTGFLFDELSASALVGALSRALAAYSNPRFARLRRRVMRQDFSWERPSRRLLQLYKKARSAKLRDSAADL